MKNSCLYCIYAVVLSLSELTCCTAEANKVTTACLTKAVSRVQYMFDCVNASIIHGNYLKKDPSLKCSEISDHNKNLTNWINNCCTPKTPTLPMSESVLSQVREHCSNKQTCSGIVHPGHVLSELFYTCPQEKKPDTTASTVTASSPFTQPFTVSETPTHNTGAIAGAVFGLIAVLTAASVTAYCLAKRFNKLPWKKDNRVIYSEPDYEVNESTNQPTANGIGYDYVTIEDSEYNHLGGQIGKQNNNYNLTQPDGKKNDNYDVAQQPRNHVTTTNNNSYSHVENTKTNTAHVNVYNKISPNAIDQYDVTQPGSEHTKDMSRNANYDHLPEDRSETVMSNTYQHIGAEENTYNILQSNPNHLDSNVACDDSTSPLDTTYHCARFGKLAGTDGQQCDKDGSNCLEDSDKAKGNIHGLESCQNDKSVSGNRDLVKSKTMSGYCLAVPVATGTSNSVLPDQKRSKIPVRKQSVNL